MNSFKLSGGTIPAIGVGTWKINDRDQMAEMFCAAVASGYRLIDTAAAYSNEISIGRTLRDLGVERSTLFIQDKLWNTNRGFAQSQEACKRSLKKLKLDYLDAYLIHWPATAKTSENWEEQNADSWRGLEQLQKEGYVRFIGVCNFKMNHLKGILESGTIMPQIMQMEIHPGYSQKETVEICSQMGMHLEASSPLGHGYLLNNDVLKTIAAQKRRTVAQICLRWLYEKGITSLPKTTSVNRLRQNCEIFDFSLSEEEKQLIEDLPFSGGLAIDPDEVIDFEQLQ